MPEPIEHHTGIAAVLDHDNIDTDQIIPSREMKAVSRKGLAEGLFAGWRYSDPVARLENPDFVLNRPEQAGTSILISGENFGCGSSREHAVWALKEFGIRAIIAKSFGEIFYGNCIRNGIVPIVLDSALVAQLMAVEGPAQIHIDLEVQTLSCQQLPDWRPAFEIGKFAKRLLTQGLDPIALTLLEAEQIEDYFQRDEAARPWVYSAA